MVDSDLVGTELPSGTYTVEDWKAYLWADGSRDEETAFRYDEDATEKGEPGQVVPHTICQHIVFQATGGIEESMSYASEDWTSGAALAGLRVEFHEPIEVGEPLHASGRISDVYEKEGSTGQLTFVTYDYDVTDERGTLIYDFEADVVLLEGE